MYNNPYMNPYNSQANIDRLNEQINNLERMKAQMQQPQPTNLTQNFQLAPSNRDVIRYANSIDEVQRDMVIGETPYFSKDMSIVWIKNSKGDIKTYELKEIVPMDERDLLIQNLQMQVNELRKEVKTNAKSIDANDDESNSSKESTDVSVSRTSKKKQ